MSLSWSCSSTSWINGTECGDGGELASMSIRERGDGRTGLYACFRRELRAGCGVCGERKVRECDNCAIRGDAVARGTVLKLGAIEDGGLVELDEMEPRSTAAMDDPGEGGGRVKEVGRTSGEAVLISTAAGVAAAIGGESSGVVDPCSASLKPPPPLDLGLCRSGSQRTSSVSDTSPSPLITGFFALFDGRFFSTVARVETPFITPVFFGGDLDESRDPRWRTRGGDGEARFDLVGCVEKRRSGSGPGVGGSSASIFSTSHLRFSSRSLTRSSYRFRDEIITREWAAGHTARAAFSFPNFTAATVNLCLSCSSSFARWSSFSRIASCSGTPISSILMSAASAGVGSCPVMSRCEACVVNLSNSA